MPAPTALTEAEGLRGQASGDQLKIAEQTPALYFASELEYLLREYQDLKKWYPEPSLEDIFADSQWASEMRSSEAFRTFARQYIAIADQKICGAGDTDIKARVNAAKSHSTHPERFWVQYVEPETWDN